MAEIELTRVAFLREGFECPVQGCGEKVTHRNIVEETGVGFGQQVPTGYRVRCPRCRTQHLVQITGPAQLDVPEQAMSRFAFLHKGFTCPVEGCGATITHNNVEPTEQNISPEPPRLYVVRCPLCRTSQVVNIKDGQ